MGSDIKLKYQASLSMGFCKQEYWSGLPFPSPGDLPNAGIEPRSPTLQADSLPSEPPRKSSYVKNESFKQKLTDGGGFLVAQWLRLCVPDTGGSGSIPVLGTRSRMPQQRPVAAK